MKKLTILSYEQWGKKIVEDLFSKGGKIKCPYCEGHGEIECTCSECEHVHVKGCFLCDSQGKVEYKNIEDCDWIPPRSEYLSAIEKDKRKFDSWVKGESIKSSKDL